MPPEEEEDGLAAEFAELADGEKAERCATLAVAGMSPRQVGVACGIPEEEARSWIAAGRLGAVRKSPADVRADHILLARMVIRQATATASNPPPLCDKAGRPQRDDDGRLIPDAKAQEAAHKTILEVMKREAKMTGADAPSRSVRFDVASLRGHLQAQGVPDEVLDGRAPLRLAALPPLEPEDRRGTRR